MRVTTLSAKNPAAVALVWVGAIIMLLLPAFESSSQERSLEQEMADMRIRIGEMQRAAEEHRRAADQLMADAEGMMRRMEEAARRERERPQTQRQTARAIEGLEIAAGALRELGRAEEINALERIMASLRGPQRERPVTDRAQAQTDRVRPQTDRPPRDRPVTDRAQAQTDRLIRDRPVTDRARPQTDRPAPQTDGAQSLRREMELLRSAIPALREAGRADTAALVERAIQAREVRLARRRDAEAVEIYAAAPTSGQELEIVAYAARLWRQFNRPERAEPLERFAEELRGRRERERTDAAPERDRPRAAAQSDRPNPNNAEAREGRRQLEVMRFAFRALTGAGRADAADLLGRGIRVRELALEGVRGERAQAARQSAPDRQQLSRILAMAAGTLRERGATEQALEVARLAELFAGRG